MSPAADPRPAPRLLPTGWQASLPAAFAVGVFVALLGTVVHRAAQPWGLLLALAATASGAVLARGLAGGAGLTAYGGGILLVTQLASSYRPGGDVVIASDAVGYAWLYASVVMCAVVAFLPGRWFASRPRGDD